MSVSRKNKLDDPGTPKEIDYRRDTYGKEIFYFCGYKFGKYLDWVG